jgi:2-C-methyl-D-erythritol 4-phosphate cytidylyltransferase
MKKYVIVVAAGTGVRMKSKIPKQFLVLDKLPILMFSLKAFYEFDRRLKIILVLPEDQINYWKKLCKDFNFRIKHNVVEGGANRFESVKKGLSKIDSDGLVAIHDGVRPLVRLKTIEKGFEIALKHGNAVPFIDVHGSVRLYDGRNSSPLERKKVKIIQTPQVFNSTHLKEAYNQMYNPYFTDDATIVESIGVKINLFEGNPENIKITTENDLKIAEYFLKK